MGQAPARTGLVGRSPGQSRWRKARERCSICREGFWAITARLPPGAGGGARSRCWNCLHGAISKVMVGHGPATFPGVGFVPAGGLLIQRHNVGQINAPGLEGDLAYRLDDGIAFRAAFDLLDQRVHGGTTAPQLTGKRPSQAPRASVTARLDVPLFERWSLSADARYEGAR